MTYSKSSNRERGLIQNPARERRTYSKSSKREKDLFKIQQERERKVREREESIAKREREGSVSACVLIRFRA